MDIGVLSKEIIEKITEEQILQMLKDFGTTPFRTTTKEIWFNTICHGGDSHKLCYFREGKDFYCYTNCGKMSLFQLVMNVRNCGFRDSVNFLARIVQINTRKGIGIYNDKFSVGKNETSSSDNRNAIRRIRKERKQVITSSITPIQPLHAKTDIDINFFEDVYYQGWIDEGITIATMEKYDIKWYEQAKHIIIPHHNIKGDIVGIRRRALDEYEIEHSGKYMPEIMSNDPKDNFAHSLGLNLYGLYQNQEAIKRYKRVIIVEAEKSVLLSDSYFGEDSIVVATCGFNITNWQRDILVKHLGVKTVILSFDNDVNVHKFETTPEKKLCKSDKEYQDYLKYCDRIIKLGQKFSGVAQVYTTWDKEGLLDLKDSPLDKGKDVFCKLLQTREKIEMLGE